jgi:hypothetical protein
MFLLIGLSSLCHKRSVICKEGIIFKKMSKSRYGQTRQVVDREWNVGRNNELILNESYSYLKM